MLKNSPANALRLLCKARQIFEAGSAKWWPGIALITASLMFSTILFVLTELVFVSQLTASVWHEEMPKINALIVSFPIVTGAAMLIGRLRAKHQSDPFYIVVKTARLGYWLWTLLTTLACMIGLVFLLSGLSPLSGAVAVFSLAFLVIGSSLAERPHLKMELGSLFLLKRIANWQLVAGSAVVALVYEAPKPGASTVTLLGDNRGLMFVLLVLWIVGAGASTVLLEPLKYKLEGQADQRQIGGDGN